MSHPFEVAVLVGSLRKESLNRKAARALQKLAPTSLRFRFVEIGDLPLYNEELEGEQAPDAWKRFRQEVGSADGVLFVTPEYNRSIPGALKNAIDVGSRPYGQAVFTNKPAAVMSVSPGALGGFGANHHLRQAISFFGMPVLSQPEAYVGQAGTLFDEAGELTSESTAAFFKTFIEAFAGLVERTAADPGEREAA